MALNGFHYLATVLSRISEESDPTELAERQSRQSNQYSGTLKKPYAGLQFSFSWRIHRGKINVAEEKEGRNSIAWQFYLNGQEIDKGRDRLNSTAGKALLTEISAAEAMLGEGMLDDPGGGGQNKIKKFVEDIEAAQAGGTILPTGAKSLATLYTEQGIT